MMKILYVIPHLENKGPVTQLLTLINTINKNDFDITIATLFQERENSLKKEYLDNGYKVLSIGDIKNPINKLFKLNKIIEEERPDIIHSHCAFADIFVSFLHTKKPIIITLHNYMYEDIIQQYGKFLGSIICFFEEKAIRSAAQVITCSDTLRKMYGNSFDKKLIAIPNGIDINKWSSKPSLDRKELRNALELPNNGVLFLSTSLFIERKNPKTIIKAFENNESNDSYLVMLGDGPLLEECKKIANSRVIFKGKVNNVKDYLYACDTLVSASRSEGLPYSILEAECTGIRMILSDIPQHHEAVHGNSYIQYFRADNISELSILLNEKSVGVERIVYDLSSISDTVMSERYASTYRSVYSKYNNIKMAD